MTTLEERVQSRLRAWARDEQRFRTAQHDCEPQSEEWHLNKESADTIVRLAGELAGDLTVHVLMKREVCH